MKTLLIILFLFAGVSASARCQIPGGDQNWVRGCGIAVHQLCKSRQICHRQVKAGLLTARQSRKCVIKGRFIPKRVRACLRNPAAFGL